MKYRKRVGYGKLGRSFPLDPNRTKTQGGDIDVCRLLHRLATENPDVEFVIFGRNQREDPQEAGYPPNVTNPWRDWWGKVYFPNIPQFMEDPRRCMGIIDSFREVSGDLHKELDELICWAGQHGSANSIIPQIGSDWDSGEEGMVTPQYSFSVYGGWFLDFVSRWKEHDLDNREEVWLCPDPRNYLKCREIKWPHRNSVLAQYDMWKKQKHERFGDWSGLEDHGFPPGVREQSCFVTNTRYYYSGLEFTTLPRPDEVECNDRPGKYEFGAVMNENRRHVTIHRVGVLQDWVLDRWPDAPIKGKWLPGSMAKMRPPRKIQPVHPLEMFGFLRECRTTLTTPASGSGWATSKPWECFAVGSVCFFHPRYDDQGHILPFNPEDTDDERKKFLSSWLRVPDRETFWERAKKVADDEGLWREITQQQRSLFDDKFHEFEGGARDIKPLVGLQAKTPEKV